VAEPAFHDSRLGHHWRAAHAGNGFDTRMNRLFLPNLRQRFIGEIGLKVLL
jgi:hypothetical protein